jgi:large subunit ribosomal protein L21
LARAIRLNARPKRCQLDYPSADVPSFDLAPGALETDFMYAIVKTGGKQYKAEKDGILIIEKLEGDAGAKIELGEVVMVCDGDNFKVGSPFVKGAKVTGEIVRQTKSKKINAFNYKAKKNERKRWGHRQPETHLRVTAIEAGS